MFLMPKGVMQGNCGHTQKIRSRTMYCDIKARPFWQSLATGFPERACLFFYQLALVPITLLVPIALVPAPAAARR